MTAGRAPRLAVGLAWVALAAGLGASPAAARAARPLGHAGRWLTDGQGRVVILHGLNMVYKLAPYQPAAAGFDDDDARFLAGHGFNAVRLGVIYAAVEPSPGRYDDRYLAGIAATVRTLARHGVRTLLDFHQDQYNERFHGEGFPAWAVQDDGLPNAPDRGFPGNLTGMPALQHAYDHFWADAPGPGGVGLQERYAAAWGHVAARFRGDPAVLGYDLFNEPWPGTEWTPCALPAGCPAFDAVLGRLQREAIVAIRRADVRHLVFYEPDLLFNFGTPTHLPALGDPRLGMSFHDYCPPGRSDCRSFEDGILAHGGARSAQTGDALLVTEWGSAADVADLERVAGLADAHQASWLEWAYCGCGDPTGAAPPDLEGLVFHPRRPPSGANVRLPALRALDRAYPQAIAGTPTRYAFDPATRTFTLSYATRPPRGRLAPGATSEVFLPALHYPRGWRVSVTGAQVVGRRTGQLLRLRARPRSTRVRVRVIPSA